MKAIAGLGAAVVLTGVVVFATNSGSFASDVQPSLEEDYNYPGAAKILADHGLKLYKGDGHIMWTATRSMDDDVHCASAEIQVEQIVDVAGYLHCFRTLGTNGYLTLEIPGTFGIRGGTQTVEATAKLPEGDQTFIIPPNRAVPIRPGTDSEPPQAILVELRIG